MTVLSGPQALGLEAPKVLNHVPQRPLEGVSFAHTFGDAQAPTHKRVQYYEMIASRAIWADGWKAVVEQPQGEMLTDEMLEAQKWELYHVAEDFSETRDLAAEHPDKLARLVEQWWAEAGKYNVLPLDSRMQLRMGERKPGSRAPARRHVFEPGGAPQFEYTAVNLKNRSHTITADVRIPPEGAQGVLFAHGSWFSGYSLYVKGDRLVYVHNYLGLQEYRITSAGPLPRGDCTLAFVFTRTGEHRGHGHGDDDEVESPTKCAECGRPVGALGQGREVGRRHVLGAHGLDLDLGDQRHETGQQVCARDRHHDDDEVAAEPLDDAVAAGFGRQKRELTHRPNTRRGGPGR